MKRTLQILLSGILVCTIQLGFAQTRYLDEVFTDDDIEMTTVTFGTNINFLTSNFAGENTAANVFELQVAVGTPGAEIPAPFFDPADGSTDVKVTDITMDVYEPIQDNDDVTEK